ncbi:DUF5343 domain-containing protein [Sulfitobacter sp. AS59]|uniref:DUF5343 domain-containing protein n=1 Tax=Sulfitobacter sp. AS59 TaxID=3135784 RepID=UPI00317F7DC4
MTNLPYLASPGNIPKALDAIRRAPTPPKVTQDFVKTKLGIPGSSGDQITTFLKRIGLAETDGSPSDIYRGLRTSDGGKALARAVKHGYKPLYDLNEYMHDCSEQELRDLVIQATGLASDARPVGLILSCLRHLIDASDFDHTEGTTLQTNRPSERPDESAFREQVQQPATPKPQELGLNIGYNINLNLPETTDIEVFNAIFKSLKEHLLRNDDI